MKLEEGEYLAHYGILRKSGRYPWGSGETPLQRSKTFLDILAEHKKSGMTESQVAKMYDDKEKGFPFTVNDVRAAKSHAINIRNQDRVRQAQRLKDKGYGYSEIARRMSGPDKTYNESTVRSLLAPGRKNRLDELNNTAEMLRRQVAEKGFIDVGAHVERDLPIGENPETRAGISKDKFQTAVSMLKEEGYATAPLYQDQQGTSAGKSTTYKVLFKPPKPNMSEDELKKHVFANRANVQLITEKTDDGGKTYRDMSFSKPISVSSKRVGVRYKEDGGTDADGVIYVRPGVKDIELGKSHYAQVRITVDGTHYLKGMAVYKNDLPSGVDLMFNTNKPNTGNKLDVMKKLNKLPLRDDKGNIIKKDGKVVDSEEIDWKNPFGALPKIEGGQIKDEHGNVTSAMNILNEQGDWSKWSRNLASQVLAKQDPSLASSQLALTYDRRKNEFEQIKNLTNPLIRRRLLESFSDETDSAAVHLKAANLPKQATRVLLPVASLKPDEVYAPSFKTGEKVALVRFPHAGRFEIPIVTVNNRNKEANELLGSKKIGIADAIGIHPKVAERLSGADFDGDTVVVIPNNRGTIKNRDPLPGLKDFDPQQYKVPTPEEDPVNGWKTVVKDSQKQDQMGLVTNLISDMTIRGASDDELAAAVRHSMVVIDSEKHNLDYKASERDNGIINLKKRYQGINPNGTPKGAATLLTRATSKDYPVKRRDMPLKDRVTGERRSGLVRTPIGTIDVKTGEKVYEPTGELDKNGKPRTFRSRKLAEVKDARTLLSDGGGTEIEQIYADHSNRLKAMANEARKELIQTPSIRKDASAAKVYAAEVASLNGKLNDALKNKPLERRAQTVANAIVKQRRQANPQMDGPDLKKIQALALDEARARTGAKKHQVDITDDEWKAIQARAISANKLDDILKNTDLEKLRERATPKDKPVMNAAITSRAQSMLRAGVPHSEIADALGISISTLESSIRDWG